MCTLLISLIVSSYLAYKDIEQLIQGLQLISHGARM